MVPDDGRPEQKRVDVAGTRGPVWTLVERGDMKIKSLLVVWVLAGLVSGCDPGKETAAGVTPPSDVADEVAEAEPEASAPACGQGEGYDQLPSGICVQSHYDVRNVRQYQDKQGRDRTRVTFAYSNGVDDVVGSIGNALTVAGYRKREPENKADGNIWVPFTKGDSGTTYLEVKPSSEGNVPGSGTFFIDFLEGPADVDDPPQAPVG